MNDKFSELVRQVIELSESKDFNEARYEWTITGMYVAEDDDDISCVCGHPHLRYLYEIRNTNNRNVLYPVGSECIKKFECDKLNHQIKMLKNGDKIFVNKGKRLDGLTYDEICRNHKDYIEFLKAHAFKAKYKKLIEYYDFKKGM